MKAMHSFILLMMALMIQMPAPMTAQAADRPHVPVGTARAKKSVVAFPDVKLREQTDELSKSARSIHEIVSGDLVFMDIFRFLDPAAFIEDKKAAGLLPDQFKFTDWSSIGAEYLIKSALSFEGKQVVLEGFLYDVTGGKSLLAKRYVASKGEVKSLAHTFANEIVSTLTGLPGIFLSKLAMSCDRTGKKEVYVMDFDGSNIKQITHHRSIAFAPAWSPDGTKVAYSLYTKGRDNIKNIDLYEFDFSSNTIRLLSNRKGINSGAAYSPDGTKMALTMSFLGNPEVFILDLGSKKVERLTHSMGFDVDPAWSPDGKSMAFVSSRTGMPMVFSMGMNGSNVKRLTFAGQYNATPSWSARGNKVAFAGWIANIFDIFIMNPDGTNIERLTKDQGNNEDPFFSPDGNFIAFSSNRTGEKNIYVMNVDGTFVRRLTYGMGNCVAPKWSNPPK